MNPVIIQTLISHDCIVPENVRKALKAEQQTLAALKRITKKQRLRAIMRYQARLRQQILLQELRMEKTKNAERLTPELWRSLQESGYLIRLVGLEKTAHKYVTTYRKNTNTRLQHLKNQQSKKWRMNTLRKEEAKAKALRAKLTVKIAALKAILEALNAPPHAYLHP